MTTTITPASGAGALYTQGGTGTTPGYSALDDRRLATAALQEGVYGTSTRVTAGGVSSVAAADFMVTQRDSGANLSVDINMPAGGMAFVQGDTLSGQGLYGVPVHSANINEALAAADATNPRVDQVILEVLDDVLDASGGNLARTRVLSGTATSGATLANRSGAATLPGSALLLADVLVAANAASVANSAIRDRRKWARGAFSRLAKTDANATTTSATMVAIDATRLQARLECSGVPVRVTFNAIGDNNTTNGLCATGCFLDGASVDGSLTLNQNGITANTALYVGYSYIAVPTAGSHTFAPSFATGAGTAGIFASTGYPVIFLVEEILSQNAVNGNGVTTG